ncbi:hypothetical protein EDB85DRAFT_1904204 [Lactarius pseudohatsudake]|nr:hypothetical protein EDB85DRAFT_1904204 [Lactarius pseudohatsudake]
MSRLRDSRSRMTKFDETLMRDRERKSMTIIQPLVGLAHGRIAALAPAPFASLSLRHAVAMNRRVQYFKGVLAIVRHQGKTGRAHAGIGARVVHYVPRRTAHCVEQEGPCLPNRTAPGAGNLPRCKMRVRHSPRVLTAPNVSRTIPHVPKRVALPRSITTKGYCSGSLCRDLHLFYGRQQTTTFSMSVLWPHVARHTSSESPRARQKTTKTKERIQPAYPTMRLGFVNISPLPRLLFFGGERSGWTSAVEPAKIRGHTVWQVDILGEL